MLKFLFNLGSTFTIFIAVFACGQAGAQPVQWQSRGIGGGGSLFAPSINPAKEDEFYVACDMSQLFHTEDFGMSYEIVDFQQIQASNNSAVRFTRNSDIRYSITYANDRATPVKSIDGGSTWSVLPGADPWEDIYTIHVDYDNGDKVIISYWSTIHLSEDGGDTFTLIYTAEDTTGSGAVIGGVFFDGSSIYMGTNDGLLMSTDEGKSFQKGNMTGIRTGEAIFSFAGAKEGSTTRFFCVTADPNDIYNGVTGTDYWGFMKGVYSIDYGSGNWTSIMNGITLGTDFLMFVATAKNDINTAYLAGSNTSGVPNIMKTSNGGVSWSHVFNVTDNQNIITGWSGSGGDQDWWYGECPFGIDVARFNSDKVIFSDMGFVHKTSDGGGMWIQAYVPVNEQHEAGSSTPRRQYYHSIGLENTSCWQVFWIDPDSMFAAYSDIRGIRSTDGGKTWSFDYTGHTQNTMYRILRHPQHGTIYAATSTIHDIYQSTRLEDDILDADGAKGKIIFSTDIGATWHDLHDFGHPVFWLALDPNNGDRMYVSVINHGHGKGGIYICNNLQNGTSASWTKLPDPPRTEGHPAAIEVLNDGLVVCTFSGRRDSSGFTPSSGVFTYNPESGIWTDVSDPGMYYWSKDIVVDPNDATQFIWYVGVFSGWGGAPNGLGGLYRTTDRGAHWEKINDLDRVTSCTFNPHNPDELYLTTEQDGLWLSRNINSSTPSFSRVSTYPFRQPERVFFNPYISGEIWVTSFGYGMKVGTTEPAAIYVETGGTCGGNSPCYSAIQPAIDTGSTGATVKVTQENYDEDLILSVPKELTIEGGWESTFTTQSSNTTVKSLTISNGTATVENLALRGSRAATAIYVWE